MADVTYGDPRLPDRYWAKVYPCPITGCWLWGGACKKAGYGNLSMDGRSLHTHRMMFAAANGYLPEYVCHQCDMPPCVNPDHLFPGDAAINSADAIRKDRHARGERMWAAVLTDEVVTTIIRLKNTGRTQYEVASQFDTEQTAVSQIWAGLTWKHLHRDPALAALIAAPTHRARPAECHRGHLFTPENTRLRPNGTRNCRMCAKLDAMKRQKASRSA